MALDVSMDVPSRNIELCVWTIVQLIHKVYDFYGT